MCCRLPADRLVNDYALMHILVYVLFMIILRFKLKLILFSVLGLGWLLLCGEHGGEHCVCVGKCVPVPALQSGGAYEHKCLQHFTRRRPHRVY